MALEEGGDGVLLYYKYASVLDVPALVDLYESNCRSLGLLGRVRIAPDGVNVTVGGKMSSLEKHIEVMRANSLFEGTDFKLASCDDPSDEKITKECGFTSLSIRVVKELVTFRPQTFSKMPRIQDAGKHLSAEEFHTILHNASPEQKKGLILLDARNMYETRIGMFQTPDVETVNPNTRQYSDLPTWIDKNSQRLQGNHVLMYCTGGIRCEMASAYIRSKGSGFEHVFQLFGGIQRYLEAFPDGGYFKGKNFVFDHRISVGSKNTDILGSCLLCNSSFDDYSPRCRCTYCRMLVLVCDACQKNGNTLYVCELCQKHGKKMRFGMPVLRDDKKFDSESFSDVIIPEGELNPVMTSAPVVPFCELSRENGYAPLRKLKILCLHGFRQNASTFKGRTASLAKKLKSICELVFVDAPHVLPFIYQPRSRDVDFDSICSLSQCNPPRENCKRKFAWLLSSPSNNVEDLEWKVADQPFDSNQYQQQTSGFDESYAYIREVLDLYGPFDGVLGFSQGAAMAALVCEEQQRRGGIPDFRFAILCSGFSLISLGGNCEPIHLPSLHVFGNRTGGDRQIHCEASLELSSFFDTECSVVIQHEMGHIIPTQSPYIDQMRAFLQRFC